MTYIEYKGVKHEIKEGETKEQVADSISHHFEELSNYQLIAKEDDSKGFVIQPKTGKKG